jgi:hypothetical protein
MQCNFLLSLRIKNENDECNVNMSEYCCRQYIIILVLRHIAEHWAAGANEQFCNLAIEPNFMLYIKNILTVPDSCPPPPPVPEVLNILV